MIAKILTRDRMNKVENVKDWKEAIRLATLPLIEDKSVKSDYVDDMIESVEKFGPYIVIDDYIAIPHAISDGNVNKQSLSLLYIDNPVDFIDKPVKLVIVLAPVDRESHMEVLMQLSEMLMDQEKKEIFLSGNLDNINNILVKEN